MAASVAAIHDFKGRPEGRPFLYNRQLIPLFSRT
jgi:hypothetical protein